MTENSLAALRRDIKRARKWAKARFPGPRTVPDDASFDEKLEAVFTPSFRLEFPDPDRLVITPLAFGETMEIGRSEYRLLWENGNLYWVGDILIRREIWGVKDEIRHYVGRAEGKP